MSRILRPLFVLLLIAGGLAACGKRGHLDPPPAQQQITQSSAATGTKPEAAGTSQAKDGSQNKIGGKKRTPITAPKRELLIDRILD